MISQKNSRTGFWLILSVFLSLVLQTAVRADETVIKSPNDDYEYQYFVLPNQLQVLTVSDPDTDKAAASLDINIGSASDPADYQGLAHFLEHMLFLGTEKYPQAGEYKQFISTHGGNDNAYTALEHTNYFFAVDKEHLEPALDRFAQFFIAPLFTATYVDRERQIVHSEYQSKLKSDGWRIRSAQKHALNPKHPAAGFNVGSVDTLADREGKSVRDELIRFYQQHYSANLMTLVVLGKEPPDVLRQWVSDKFSAIQNTQAQALEITEPMFSEGSLPLRMDVVPVKDSRQMTLTFPIPPLQPHYRVKPVNFIANLLGHEGKGSLLSFLKSKGWVEALSAGAGDTDSNGAVLSISFELTAAGMQQLDTIIASVFQYLRLIERNGIEQWIFHEQQQLAEAAFRFQEQGEPGSYVQALASNLHDYPASDVLRGPYAMDTYDPALIRDYMTYLKPENMMVAVSAPGLETDAVDSWFDVPYRIARIEPQQIEGWKQATTTRHPGHRRTESVYRRQSDFEASRG